MNPQLVAGRAADHEAVAVGVELQSAEVAGKVAQGDFVLRGALGVVGSGQVHLQFRVRGGADQDVHAVIDAGASLADEEMAVFQPHRARLIGFDPQWTNLRERALADGDGPFPEPQGAAPDDADPHRRAGGRGILARAAFGGHLVFEPAARPSAATPWARTAGANASSATAKAQQAARGLPVAGCSVRDVLGRPCPVIVDSTGLNEETVVV